MSDSSHTFSAAERVVVHRAIAGCHDMRHFSSGSVASELLARLLGAAYQAPSVGPMQPRHFIRIAEPALRRVIHGLIEDERGHTAEAFDGRFDEFMRLKAEDVLDCAELLVAALMDDRERYVLGCRTLSQTDLTPLIRAIQNLWLASRAEGLGIGWISLFDPTALGKLLGLPPGNGAVAMPYPDPVAEFCLMPMLVLEGWSEPRPLVELVYQNRQDEQA